jgi:hypothetical protein
MVKVEGKHLILPQNISVSVTLDPTKTALLFRQGHCLHGLIHPPKKTYQNGTHSNGLDHILPTKFPTQKQCDLELSPLTLKNERCPPFGIRSEHSEFDIYVTLNYHL